MRFLLLFTCFVALSQDPQFGHPTFPPKDEPKDVKLPNGKSQNEEILKVEYQKSVEDAAQLVMLSQSLQKEIDTDGRHVLSIASIKKTEEIEKIAKRIRGRMRRF